MLAAGACCRSLPCYSSGVLSRRRAAAPALFADRCTATMQAGDTERLLARISALSGSRMGVAASAAASSSARRAAARSESATASSAAARYEQARLLPGRRARICGSAPACLRERSGTLAGLHPALRCSASSSHGWSLQMLLSQAPAWFPSLHGRFAGAALGGSLAQWPLMQHTLQFQQAQARLPPRLLVTPPPCAPPDHVAAVRAPTPCDCSGS